MHPYQFPSAAVDRTRWLVAADNAGEMVRHSLADVVADATLVASVGPTGTVLANGLALTFALPVPIVISRNGGLYSSSLTAKSRDVARGITYYLSPSGNDSNSGLTPSAPKKSIATLVTALFGNAPAGGVRFVLAPGYYSATAAFNAASVTFDASFVCPDGIAYIPSGRAGPEFTLLGDAVYKRAGHSVAGVVTWKFRDGYGAPLKLALNETAWANEAAVQAGLAAGQYTSYTGNCYIRLPDDSVPGAETLTISAAANTLFSLPIAINKSIYLENIRMTGNGGCISWQSSSNNAKTFTALNVEAAGNTDATKDIFTLVVDSGSVVLERCRADHGVKDGFNYHQGVSPAGGWGMELNCVASQNGSNAASNGSTTHETVKMLRAGGVYSRNYGRNINDINASQSLLIGCAAGLSQASGGGDDVAFETGQSGGTDTSVMWCVDCRSLGGGANVVDYWSTGLSTMWLIGSSGTERGCVSTRGSKGSLIRA